MSLRIEGYRIPLYRLTEATELIHNIQYNINYDKICRIANNHSLIEKSENIIDEFFEKAHRETKNIYTSPLNLKCGFNVFIDGEISEKGFAYAYIVPWGLSIADNIPDWFEDFHTPEDISTEEYKERYKVWVRVGAFNFNRTLTHTSVDADTILDFERRWFRENKR
jgi:hypothetical protein